jgi:hypothetical protein
MGGSFHFLALASNPDFQKSEIFKTIIGRCFDNDIDMINACKSVMVDIYPNPTVINKLDKLGYYFKDHQRFVSNLFYDFILNRVANEIAAIDDNIEIDFNTQNAIYEVLAAALKRMSKNSFFHKDQMRLENGISTFLFGYLKSIPGVYVSPQYCIKAESVPLQQGIGKAGHPPTVDFYINGKINTFVEVIRNGSNLDKHISRFDKDGRYYQRMMDFKSDYVIFDIDLEKEVPNEVNNDRYCSYQYLSNTFYANRGKLMLQNACPRIRSPEPAKIVGLNI